MSETKTIYVQSVESKSGMGKNNKPWKSYNVTATSGEKLSGFDNQWGEEPLSGDCFELDCEWEEQYKNWKVKKGLKVIQSDGGFYDGAPTDLPDPLPNTTRTPPKPTPVTFKLLWHNIEAHLDAAGIAMGGDLAVKNPEVWGKIAAIGCIWAQKLNLWVPLKDEEGYATGGETAVEFLKTELRKNYNDSKLPPDWKERVAVAGQSTAAMELLTCLFDSTNILIDIKREEAQKKAKEAKPLTDGDIPF
jgi:hypothetical protein